MKYISAPPHRLSLVAPPYHPKVEEAIASMRFGAVRPMNLVRALAHSPGIMSRAWALGGALLYRMKLPRREQEIAIIRVGARTRSEYEWGMHVALFANECGLGEDDISALTRGAPDDARWSRRESLLIRLVDEVHETSTVSDALWQAIAAEWPESDLVEITVLVGYYHMMSFVLNTLGVPPEAGAATFDGALSRPWPPVQPEASLS